MFKLIPTFILFLVFPGLSFASVFDSFQSSYSLEEIQKESTLTLPITSKREAVEFAKSKGLLSKPPYDELKQKGFKNWFVLVAKYEGNWHVTIQTKDLLPSYSCVLAFDKSGNIMESKNMQCGFNK